MKVKQSNIEYNLVNAREAFDALNVNGHKHYKRAVLLRRKKSSDQKEGDI